MNQPGSIEIYLYFNGQCEDALNFYQQILGGEVSSLLYYNEVPLEDRRGIDIENPHAIMHAVYHLGEVTLMASDNVLGTTVTGDNVVLNWFHPDSDEVRRVWQAFVDGGAQVSMPLESTFFSPLYGALTDPFGISWQIMTWQPSEESETPAED